jgi:hypothetical protein
MDAARAIQGTSHSEARAEVRSKTVISTAYDDVDFLGFLLTFRAEGYMLHEDSRVP